MTQTQAPGLGATQDEHLEALGKYRFGWHDADTAGASARRGLNDDVVRDISARKGEPEWMLERRLRGLKLFERKPMPTWGADLGGIDFDNIKYFVKSTEKQARRGRTCPRTSRTPTTASASPRPRSSASSPASPRSTSPRSSTTRSTRSWSARASSSSTPTRA